MYNVTTDYLLRGISEEFPKSAMGVLANYSERLTVRNQLLLENILRVFLESEREVGASSGDRSKEE
jgi:hypothetical protein